jgi:hypothetical protein
VAIQILTRGIVRYSYVVQGGLESFELGCGYGGVHCTVQR